MFQNLRRKNDERNKFFGNQISLGKGIAKEYLVSNTTKGWRRFRLQNLYSRRLSTFLGSLSGPERSSICRSVSMLCELLNSSSVYFLAREGNTLQLFLRIFLSDMHGYLISGLSISSNRPHICWAVAWESAKTKLMSLTKLVTRRQEKNGFYLIVHEKFLLQLFLEVDIRRLIAFVALLRFAWFIL